MARIRPAKVIVLATPKDRALSLSSALALSRQRVGAIDASNPSDREEIEKLGAKVVDISAYSDADRFIAHSVYADSPQVLAAIGSALQRVTPQEANSVSDTDARNYPDPEANRNADRRRARLASGDRGIRVSACPLRPGPFRRRRRRAPGQAAGQPTSGQAIQQTPAP